MSLKLYAPIIERLDLHGVPSLSVQTRESVFEGCEPEKLIYRFLPVEDAITDRSPSERADAVRAALPDHTVEPLTFMSTLHNALELNNGVLHRGNVLAFCIELTAGYGPTRPAVESLYKCDSPNCPGRPYRASEQRHPEPCKP